MRALPGTHIRMKGANVKARPINPTAPTAPGRFFWSEWNAEVEVFKKGRKLFVTPPGGVTIPVTPHLAGRFKEIH